MPTSDKLPDNVVIFGGVTYNLPAKFNLGELRDISIEASRKRPADPAEAEKQLFETSAAIIEAAVRRVAQPKLTLDAIYLADTSLEEVFTARMRILRWSGLLPKEGEKPAAGEDQAGASTSTGETSTAV